MKNTIEVLNESSHVLIKANKRTRKTSRNSFSLLKKKTVKKWKGITSWQIAVRRAHAKVDNSAVSDSAHWWYFSSLISSCHVSDVFHFSIRKLKTKVWCVFCFFRKQEAHVRHKRHLDTVWRASIELAAFLKRKYSCTAFKSTRRFDLAAVFFSWWFPTFSLSR